VRPTTDFAREGLFNILNRLVDYEEVRVLDLFAGTGAVTFEFLSRGALSVTAVDIEHDCVTFIRNTAAEYGMEGLNAVRSNALVFLKQRADQYDVIFADPPYEMSGVRELPALIMGSGKVRDGGLVVLEHSDRYDFRNATNFLELRKYGRVHFTFFRVGKGKDEA
jgi:16S rRNA (guanine966-N2)-methyltransferase